MLAGDLRQGPGRRYPGHRGTDLVRRQRLRDQAGDRTTVCVLAPAQRRRPVRLLRPGGGCLITGNEDGVKHCAMNVLYSLQHLGYTIPPQADAGWIGEVGPGPSYLDPGSGGPDNDFTNRNTTFMTWNLPVRLREPRLPLTPQAARTTTGTLRAAKIPRL